MISPYGLRLIISIENRSLSLRHMVRFFVLNRIRGILSAVMLAELLTILWDAAMCANMCYFSCVYKFSVLVANFRTAHIVNIKKKGC